MMARSGQVTKVLMIGALGVASKSKRFFFEKKKQKAFVAAVAEAPASSAQGTKVFWFFFSKKNCLLCFSPPFLDVDASLQSPLCRLA